MELRSKGAIMEQKTVATQIRLSESLYSYIQAKASELGISQNAMMCILIDLGRKVYSADLAVYDPSG
jgi:hypothetical protein